MTADYEVHAAVQADLLDEARQLLRELLDEHARLKATALQLAIEGMGLEPVDGEPGQYAPTAFPFSFLSGLTIERVNELLAPFGFPGLVRLAP